MERGGDGAVVDLVSEAPIAAFGVDEAAAAGGVVSPREFV